MPKSLNNGYESETVEISSSVIATPPVVSSYPNLPNPTNSKLTFKTRRELNQNDIDDCIRILTEVFGHNNFKGKQQAIVEAAYGGADVLVVAPTGMGKSLCFQIPAIADKRGVSVVVSPLLALMQNQIEKLRLKNIEVAALSSNVSPSEKDQISQHLQLYDTRIKLLYVTPERLCKKEFMDLLDVVHENHNLNRLVVDEAHCISEWGHDFREEYRKIGKFRDRYPEVPIMALTATATQTVQKDIIQSLKLPESHLFVALHPFNRENLYYEVRYLSNPDPSSQMANVFDFISTLHRRRGRSSPGIIYCRFRKTCNELSSYLRGKGLNSRPYHRGIPSATLDKTLKGWTTGEGGVVDLVVATIAFGLGIDKADVRYIIHYDLPKSFEGYYQETGRAGRDGHPSKCVLYYSREDALRVQRLVRNPTSSHAGRDGDDGPTPTQRAAGSLESLINYAESGSLCRHVSICRYFGEPIDELDGELVRKYCSKMCDVCKYPDKTKAKLSRLSSHEKALANAPPLQFNNNNGVTPNNQKRFNKPDDQASTSRGLFGQKRPVEGFPEIPAKKQRVGLAPMLVTKPFGSASSLSKPFKPPSLTRPVAKENVQQIQTSIPCPRKEIPKPPLSPKPVPKAPDLMIDLDALDDVQLEEDELSPPVDLPELGLFWEGDHSSKASMKDREDSFEAIRRSLHRTLVLSSVTNQAWLKICNSRLSKDSGRDEAIFNAAVELEQLGLSHSSTLEGYKRRISSIRSDIRALSKRIDWDKINDLEYSQDVIDCLQRSFSSIRRKGKQRA